jgi:hypothetical protein
MSERVAAACTREGAYPYRRVCPASSSFISVGCYALGAKLVGDAWALSMKQEPKAHSERRQASHTHVVCGVAALCARHPMPDSPAGEAEDRASRAGPQTIRGAEAHLRSTPKRFLLGSSASKFLGRFLAQGPLIPFRLLTVLVSAGHL